MGTPILLLVGYRFLGGIGGYRYLGAVNPLSKWYFIRGHSEIDPPSPSNIIVPCWSIDTNEMIYTDSESGKRVELT